MRIGIDVRCLTAGKRTGVEEYTISLLEELFTQDHENEYVLFSNTWHGTQKHLAWATQFANVKIVQTHYPNKLLNLALWYFKRPHLDRLIGGVDVFFMPNINFASFSSSVKVVLTVHDLSFAHARQTFSLKRRLWHFFVHPRQLIARADHIIAVSHATRADIVGTYGIEAGKIRVIHNGVADLLTTYENLQSNEREKSNEGEYGEDLSEALPTLPAKYILYFGTIEPRKNIVAIIHAYEQLRTRHQCHQMYKLVLAGETGWKSDAIYDAVARSPYRRDIIVLGAIAQKDKSIIYARAAVLVYPSHFEGFGLPLAEGLLMHIPVITSFSTSLPEIAADHAIMINPDSSEEIYRALHMIFTDAALQKRLVTSTQINYGEKFSWTIAARQTYTIFMDAKQQTLL